MAQRGILVVAIVFGLIAVVLVNQYTSKLQAQYKTAKVEVVVANANIPAGNVITGNDLGKRSVLADTPTEYSYLWPNKSRVEGLTARTEIKAGSLIYRTMVVESSGSDKLSTKIEQGYRAVTLPVDAVYSQGYSIQDGDHVDILATFKLPNDNKVVTKTILQNVLVLATGTAADPQKGKYGTVTVKVSPKNAELLTFTLNVQRGQINLVLRHEKDTEQPTLDSTDFAALFTTKQDPEMKLLEELKYQMELFLSRLDGKWPGEYAPEARIIGNHIDIIGKVYTQQAKEKLSKWVEDTLKGPQGQKFKDIADAIRLEKLKVESAEVITIEKPKN